jgi:hypothetical protein
MKINKNVFAKARRILALFFFVGIILLFLDFTGTVHSWLGWMAKIQFLPAVLAMNVVVVVLLVALTLLFGRIYCSVICPLGIMQDMVSWSSGLRKKKKYRFSYSKEIKWLRYGVLIIFIVSLIAGIGSFVALLAPYSSFGRIVSNIFAPVYQWGNNLLAYIAERRQSYSFYETEIWIKSLPVFITAVVTFIVLCLLSWNNGRTYCNTICPVGTVLGFLSRISLFRIVIDENKCNKCGLCSRKCKAACIDGKEHTVDYSRCVMCMDCIGVCNHGAIDFKFVPRRTTGVVEKKDTLRKETSENISISRRNFLSLTSVIAANTILKAQEKIVDGGLAVIEDKKIPVRATPIVPPGALSLRNMSHHCTGCQLCVSVCPNGVLRPSSQLDTFMQPEMSYERGYCRPECTKCSEVCPAGAIRKITTADKSSIQIGHAVWVKENCVVLTDGVECGNCARHCPVGAILMIPSDSEKENSPYIPMVNTERCIGCGACENLCPARPFSAIYIEGHECHRII